MADIISMQDRIPGIPGQEGNRQAPGQERSDIVIANEVKDFHWNGLRSRRLRDLTAEKYLLHVDGEGGAQWLDIYHGTRLKIPTSLTGAPRIQNNQLRPILDNFVSHLTTRPFRFVVEHRLDRESRETASVDQALINYYARYQKWNALWAEAKYMAACYGFCPVHAAWRDDMNTSPYEAILAIGVDGQPMQGPVPGAIDNWVGNPFDHVFDTGARRGSIHRQSYGRVLPAQKVREAFNRPDLEGNDRLGASSTFQRVVSKWSNLGGNIHGSAAQTSGQGGDELIGVIYDEIMPCTEYPVGELRIIAMNGMAATSRDDARGGVGSAELLWKGRLPAGVFSSVNVYSHQRHDDPLGKPFIGDIDDDQIHLNQLESLVDEYLRRASRPPLASSGRINVDTLTYRQDTVLEVEPLASGQVELKYLEYPARHVNLLQAKIQRVLDGMYRKGGWQAASRGEGNAGDSGKKVVALQQADDSIFGPIERRTAEEAEAFAALNWTLTREFADASFIIDIVGDEMAYVADPSINRNKLSKRPPIFTLTSGFGTSTESQAQQLLNMFGMVDQKGEQLLGTRELRRLWPDNSLFIHSDDSSQIREMRPVVINQSIRNISQQMREMYPQLPASMSDPMIQMAAQQGAQQVDAQHPALMDDSDEHHIEVLSILTQDETEDPLARRIAMFRQQQYWQRLAKKQKAAEEAAARAQEKNPTNRSGSQSNEQAFSSKGTSVNSASMEQADANANKRARQA